jgi:hypothetical protein
VLSVSCAKDGTFLLSLDGEAGAVWHCAWGQPPTALRRGGAAVASVSHSKSGKYLLTAAVDGAVTIAPEGSNEYWRGGAHADAKRVGACLSFDDAFLLSAGRDGIYVHKLLPNDPRDAILAEATLPLKAEEGAEGGDIREGSAYSIEEAKQKAESDAKQAQADEKKLGVRGQMSNLRKEFEAILKENEAMPEKERLPRDAFHIDPGLKESIEAETEARLEETKAELAWASEKAALGLEKMEETFLTSSAVEAMELKALGDAQLKVSSFRTTELADWQKEAMEQVHELIEAEQARGAWGKQASGAADYSAEEAGGEEDESGLPGAAARRARR